jgi:hypothetical protein
MNLEPKKAVLTTELYLTLFGVAFGVYTALWRYAEYAGCLLIGMSILGYVLARGITKAGFGAMYAKKMRQPGSPL